MKKEITEIGIVLDKSGSMGSIRNDTIGGVNTFIEDQIKADGDANMTLVSFNQSVYIIQESVDINTIDLLTKENYVPNGMTALYDAIGVTIGILKANIDKREDADKPEKVIVVVITDGFENSSKDHTAKDIRTTIKEMENKYDWEFIYLGANQDAFEVGGAMGFRGGSTRDWDVTADGADLMYSSLSKSVSGYRKTGEVKFEDDDKE